MILIFRTMNIVKSMVPTMIWSQLFSRAASTLLFVVEKIITDVDSFGIADLNTLLNKKCETKDLKHLHNFLGISEIT